MTAYKLEHFTILCADMEKTKDFYCDVVGLKVGDRPDLGVKGYWLYAGDTPSVHLLDKEEMASLTGKSADAQADTAALDHVAFICRGLDSARQRLKSNNIDFNESEFPGLMTQLFVKDPDNILVELNFRIADQGAN